MAQSTFVRARRPEHKQQRREAILAAARELAAESGVRNVSLGDIARAVGIAKSNVVRYFGTREEIYLELVLDCGREWADDVRRRLPDDGVVDALARAFDEHPLLCDLLSHSATSFEHNVSVEAAATFKRTLLVQLRELSAAIAEASAELTESEAQEVVTAAAGLATALYPAANPPPTLVEVYARNPDLAGAHVAFLPAMTRAISALVAGLPSLR
ncbi:TetR/AcrR family transcriptional regulator [Prauserella muralis]|uniref:TetR family transcriptional regulator n=1 Tax=Prauserella muralis TaxID=588067 RepID=A0A2V4AQE6_9PSEU|nr:TetR/AcrR family transcriptional regulator [Prauserella muralis]PXY22817.1 TetR family transcriptional regulator [Prauserella muralis]TWE28566.1 TetR family transcriptional regulator [Prauserella muralis]